MIWDAANQGRQAKYPDTAVVRFVARNFYSEPDRSKVHFLDIGSGRHAPHTRYLEGEGFTVTSVDFSQNSLAHIHQDIRSVDSFDAESFDCILDFNTLCHVEDPPFAKIKTWLKPGGYFFSVTPRDDTWRGHLEGKGYCRCPTLFEVCKLYEDFAPLEIGWCAYTNNGREVTSWIVEGGK